MARSLDLPGNLNICIRSDSTLATYKTLKSADQGLPGKKNKSVLPHLKQKHPHYTLSSDVINGGSLSDAYNSLPKDPDLISTFDVAIVACNGNTPGARKALVSLCQAATRASP